MQLGYSGRQILRYRLGAAGLIFAFLIALEGKQETWKAKQTSPVNRQEPCKSTGSG